jgi:hypothetical protein
MLFHFEHTPVVCLGTSITRREVQPEKSYSQIPARQTENIVRRTRPTIGKNLYCFTKAKYRLKP